MLGLPPVNLHGQSAPPGLLVPRTQEGESGFELGTVSLQEPTLPLKQGACEWGLHSKAHGEGFQARSLCIYMYTSTSW